MAEGAQSVSELPVKRPRVEEENGGVSVEMELNNGGATELPECMSSVIPGWFSEISPMWPGNFVFHHFWRRAETWRYEFLNTYSSVFVNFFRVLGLYILLFLGCIYLGCIWYFVFRGSWFGLCIDKVYLCSWMMLMEFRV